jgi:hypothetical protein
MPVAALTRSSLAVLSITIISVATDHCWALPDRVYAWLHPMATRRPVIAPHTVNTVLVSTHFQCPAYEHPVEAPAAPQRSASIGPTAPIGAENRL